MLDGGHKMGRPPAKFDMKLAEELLRDTRRSMTDIAQELGVHKNTLYRYFDIKRTKPPKPKTVKVMGRPKASIDFDLLETLLRENDKSVREMAEILGVHHNTLYKYLQLPLKEYEQAKQIRQQVIETQKEEAEERKIEAIRFKHEMALMFQQSVDERKVLRNQKLLDAIAERERKNAEKRRIREEKRLVPLRRKLELGIGKVYCADPSNKFRTCKTCFQIKPLDKFYFKKQTGTYRFDCIPCYRQKESARWFERGRFNRRSRAKRAEELTTLYPFNVDFQMDGGELVIAINNLVPKGIPEQIRADICQDMLVAVLSGESQLENLRKELPRFKREAQKLFASKYNHVSLDAPVDYGSRNTFHDILAAPESESYNPAFITTHYGNSLNDCETVEDLAERLNDAWSANRLKEKERRHYSTKISRSHKEDNRGNVASCVMSSSVPFGVHPKRHFTPRQYDYSQVKQQALDYAVLDYLEQRTVEESCTDPE